MTTKRFWFVRAGEGAAYVDRFLSEKFVGIGWTEVGEILPGQTDREVEQRFNRAFPADREGSRRVWAAQVKRFLNQIEKGDPVATYDPDQRVYFLGTIESDPEWRPDENQSRIRRVAWTHRAYRDELSTETRNTLGAIATLFLVSEEASRNLREKAVPVGSERAPEVPAREPVEQAKEDLLRKETAQKADQFIEDQIAKLDWQELQKLVAGILRAMGYKPRIAEVGSDRGVDIFASRDGLGLEEPRIFVEVKHRLGTQMGSQEIRAFLGGRKGSDKCLYVSTGGFSKDAKYEANRANVALELITLRQLRELLVEHYESLDSETRRLVPLRRLYWPLS